MEHLPFSPKFQKFMDHFGLVSTRILGPPLKVAHFDWFYRSDQMPFPLAKIIIAKTSKEVYASEGWFCCIR